MTTFPFNSSPNLSLEMKFLSSKKEDLISIVFSSVLTTIPPTLKPTSPGKW